MIRTPGSTTEGRKPRALDLFCGAGGATRGLQLAGFHVTGVDIKPQPRYVGDEFHQGTALAFPLDGFDFIWASPPCQAHSDMKFMANARAHADLIPATRDLLRAAGTPWVIENVEGAPLTIGQPGLFYSETGIVLCGSMFRLSSESYELRRHRLFESSFALQQPRCQHGSKPVVGFYGDHARIRRRRPGSKDRGKDIIGREAKLALVRDLMGIDWMEWSESNQAIPPAYSEFIGRQAMQVISREAA